MSSAPSDSSAERAEGCAEGCASLAPRHVAIVMDGNGRWARARGGLRADGHRAGVRPVRTVIQECVRRGIGALTLFAFSSENWSRPREEVMALMALFVESLEAEIPELHAQGVRLRFIGERVDLDARLRASMASSEQTTAANGRLALQVALSYGGRADILAAARRLALQVERHQLGAEQIDEPTFAAALALGGLPDPDLFIRTGGEQRISNFLLWNLAYTELYFTERLWPDFDAAAFEEALRHFAVRQRRFGLTGEQVEAGRGRGGAPGAPGARGVPGARGAPSAPGAPSGESGSRGEKRDGDATGR
ncbi:MAG TPA: polyprenyl diphosphate synthase [Steroidobacteraceae bacterium]|nr:polyprenyl diphosphate synthase [Steroidobacteraceae bacterium]